MSQIHLWPWPNASATMVDYEYRTWSKITANHQTCTLCGAVISSGWYCLDGPYVVCNKHVIHSGAQYDERVQ